MLEIGFVIGFEVRFEVGFSEGCDVSQEPGE